MTLPPSCIGPARREIERLRAEVAALSERCERLAAELHAAQRRAGEAERAAERDTAAARAPYVELVRSLRDTCKLRVEAGDCDGYVERGMRCVDCPMDFIDEDDLRAVERMERCDG